MDSIFHTEAATHDFYSTFRTPRRRLSGVGGVADAVPSTAL